MPTLVDTSVWIDHFRHGNSHLISLLERDDVLIHPLVVGELACGHMKNRNVILDSLQQLPTAKVVTLNETLSFIEKHRLFGKGLGIVDIQLLAACLLNGSGLLTQDKKLSHAFHNL